MAWPHHTLILGHFGHAVVPPPMVSAALRQTHPEAPALFKDACLLDLLELPQPHSEADLHACLLVKLRDFLMELGRDFCFVGSELPLQVGGRDFVPDLLLLHRGLNRLVAIELKAGRFEPEYLGKLGISVEALDRGVRKPHGHPAIACCRARARTTKWSRTPSAAPPVRR